MQATAEGIELPAQIAQLRTLGCDTGQGFLFARPTAAENLTIVVSASRLDRLPDTLSLA
jgi:EAL domain-containing protein (putative c-di-GMP-specific phosphodiesterase class I)